MAKKRNKKELIKLVTQYGVHIWAILIIANAALVYAFHYSTQASEKLTVTTSQAAQDDTSTNENNDLVPKGPVISLDFTIPGIGSNGATMTPIRLKRNVTVYLYSTEVNSTNPTVKPLYTIKTTATFEKDPNSPLYTTFGNHFIDLGESVKEADYQVLFRTDESLRTLIKQNPDDIGGLAVHLAPASIAQPFPVQTVLMGDTLPKEGDNLIDISDYNAFVNCFGARSTSKFCVGNNYGDFDDNGSIDGIDYNILLLSFQALLKQGQTIPKISIAPTGPARVSKLSDKTTPTPTKKAAAKVTPTKAPAATASTASGTGNVLGGILFFIFLILLGVGGFFFLKKNEAMRTKIMSILHMSPTGTPNKPTDPADPDGTGTAETVSTDPAVAPETTESTVAIDVPPTNTAAETAPPTEAAANPTDIAASTEVPIESLAATPPPADTTTTETPAVETPPATTIDATAPAADGTIEKECYVKKVGPDEAGTGFWIRLTDDNGATEAHYTGADVVDGFAKVKGIMKTENDKTFLEVSELTTEG